MQKSKKDRIVSGVRYLLDMMTVALFPCFFLYGHNANEGSFSELYPAMWRFLLIALVMFLAAIIVLRKAGAATFFSEIATLILMNFYSIYLAIHKHYYGFGYRYFAVIVLAILVLLVVVLWRIKIDWSILAHIVGLLFGVLIVINMVTAIPAIIQNANNKPNYVSSISDTVFAKEDRPNVYYFIFDEYGGYENLMYYFDFDNAEFEKEMNGVGFNISHTSRNTESILSASIIPNILNLDYVVDDSVYSVDRWNMTENPVLYQIFENNDYTIHMINHVGQLGDANCKVLNVVPEKTNLSTSLIGNSVWVIQKQIAEKQHMKKGFTPTSYNYVLRNVLDLMVNVSDYVSKSHPTLTVSYVCCPHDYFVFDEEGNYLPDDYSEMWTNGALYVNQMKYLNSRIEQMVDKILEDDPDALIIFQADHGARVPYMQEIKQGLTVEYDMQEHIPYMQNILNMVYYHGEIIDIEGLSGINTWRTVLNSVYGTEFEMIEQATGYQGP